MSTTIINSLIEILEKELEITANDERLRNLQTVFSMISSHKDDGNVKAFTKLQQLLACHLSKCTSQLASVTTGDRHSFALRAVALCLPVCSEETLNHFITSILTSGMDQDGVLDLLLLLANNVAVSSKLILLDFLSQRLKPIIDQDDLDLAKKSGHILALLWRFVDSEALNDIDSVIVSSYMTSPASTYMIICSTIGCCLPNGIFLKSLWEILAEVRIIKLIDQFH